MTTSETTSSSLFSDLVDSLVQILATKTSGEGEVAAAADIVGPDQLHILDFVTEFPQHVNWLADVEMRIQNSIHPFDPNMAETGEWLPRDTAFAALQFFRDGCDLMPGEPHLYGTSEGELVAEFESGSVRMTSVVSDDGATLFGYRRDNDEMPHQLTIRRGSNQGRFEIKSFTQALGVDPHGKTVEAGT